MAGANRLVGMPWHALREACYSNYADGLVIVDYDLLVARPKEVVDVIYTFLGEAPFAHDFDAVHYDAPEFDAQLGLDGLHRVHPTVASRPRKTILPPDLFEKYANLSFWRNLQNSAAHRITVQSDQPQTDTLPTATSGAVGQGAPSV